MDRLHYASVLLNPYYLTNHNLHDNMDVKSGLLQALRKLVINGNEDFAHVVGEYHAFKEGRGTYANMPNITQTNLKPHEWQDLVGKCGPTLVPIAKRILAQVNFAWHPHANGIGRCTVSYIASPTIDLQLNGLKTLCMFMLAMQPNGFELHGLVRQPWIFRG